MATSYKTPGVYINEVSTLPASVAQVPTAIPAFVGYTEFAIDTDGSSLLDTPKRITSMVEYVQFFGGSADPKESLGSNDAPKVMLDETNGDSITSIDITLKYVMYQSLSLYFSNGGGACYIVSVGDYDYDRADTDVETDITAGLLVLESEDEPTILLAPDAALMFDTGNDIKLGNIQKKMLIQCNKMQDRFAIMDLIEDAASDDVGEANFRDEVGMQYLKYGAAYGPHLETSLSYSLQYKDLAIENSLGDVKDTGLFDATVEGAIIEALEDLEAIQGLIDADYLQEFIDENTGATDTAKLVNRVTHIKTAASAIRDLILPGELNNTDILNKVIESADKDSDLATIIQKARAYDEGCQLPVSTPAALGVFGDDDFDGSVTEFLTLPAGVTPADLDFDLTNALIVADSSIYGTGLSAERLASATTYFQVLMEQIIDIMSDIKDEALRILSLLEESLVSVDTLYASIKRAIAANGIIIPPSGAVAGAYVATDANRGVWKAPANVSLNNVVKPTIKIDNATQEGLNVDATSGKSINAIRSFTGKGVLIWGARTLAGNDNEWRYVPVRRLFITVEESIKKATEFVVFESNDANTWLRTKTMIQNYLTGLWRQGALAGAKPEDAFFVNVGLGSTMTAQDILEGKMIVEIGLAAVRPAEFIILKFSHKLQE